MIHRWCIIVGVPLDETVQVGSWWVRHSEEMVMDATRFIVTRVRHNMSTGGPSTYVTLRGVDPGTPHAEFEIEWLPHQWVPFAPAPEVLNLTARQPEDNVISADQAGFHIGGSLDTSGDIRIGHNAALGGVDDGDDGVSGGDIYINAGRGGNGGDIQIIGGTASGAGYDRTKFPEGSLWKRKKGGFEFVVVPRLERRGYDFTPLDPHLVTLAGKDDVIFEKEDVLTAEYERIDVYLHTQSRWKDRSENIVLVTSLASNQVHYIFEDDNTVAAMQDTRFLKLFTLIQPGPKRVAGPTAWERLAED